MNSQLKNNQKKKDEENLEKECHSAHCCFHKTEPTPVSDHFQKLRKQIMKSEFDEISIDEKDFKITRDMIVGDILKSFPQTNKIFEDANPFGLNSHTLDRESIDLFLAGTGIDVQNLCDELNKSIKSINFEIR